jgi:hypothetical protein
MEGVMRAGQSSCVHGGDEGMIHFEEGADDKTSLGVRRMGASV